MYQLMNSIGKFTALAMSICCLLLSNSCVKEDDETTYSKQEEELFNYVETRALEYVEYGNGVWRLIEKEGRDDIIVSHGSKIKIDYSLCAYSSLGVVLVATNVGTAEADEWLTVGKKELIAGLDIGIIGAGLNEECEVVFTARHGFGNKQMGVIPKMMPLLVRVTVKEIE